MKSVYLAGPDVFHRNAADLMRTKGEMALEFGFRPSTLAEEDLDPVGLTAQEFGFQIARLNEMKMNESDFVIANLTPFRGISADIGTAYEVGYMRAQGKPVFGYTNTARDYFTRLTKDYYAGEPLEVTGGMTRGRDGMMIENHGMIDNLMLDTAAHDSGGAFIRGDVPADGDLLGDLAAYRVCLQAAHDYWARR